MNNKRVFLPIISVIFACVTVVSIFTYNYKSSPIEVDYSTKDNSVVFPVLYFEQNIGQLEYSTRTFMLKNNKVDEIEPHNRSFSKTYPISALENLSNANETYGQLLAYHKMPNDPIYIFDKSTSKDKENTFILLSNGNESYIDYTEDEYFFNLLWFNNQYYVFCLEQKDKSYDDYDILNVYLFSNELEKTGSFSINIAENNIKPYNLINKSFAVNNSSIMFPVKIQQTSYYFVFEIKTGKTQLLEKQYKPIGAISDNDIFYFVGHDESKLIIETISSDGKLLATQSNELGFTPNRLIDTQVNFDQILYMYDDNIYGCYSYLDAIYYFSYNLVDSISSNVWEVTKRKNDLLLMNNKFVLYNQNQFFDLIPNTNNNILYEEEL